jgi:hypothetical protein
VHDSQEAYQRAMRQPTVSGPDTTWLPACASCGLCTPSLEVAERKLTTRPVSAFSLGEAVEFAASPPLRQLVASPLAVGGNWFCLHPELVTVRLPHSAGAAGAGAAPDAASVGLAPPPAWRARVDGALGMTTASAPPAATSPDLAFAGTQNAATGGRAGGGAGGITGRWPRPPGPLRPLGTLAALAHGSAQPLASSGNPAYADGDEHLCARSAGAPQQPPPPSHTHDMRRSGTRRSHAVGCARNH